MTDAREWLTRAETLTNAATDGPWTYGGQGWVFADAVDHGAFNRFDDLLADVKTSDQDAEFIAAARTGWPASNAGLRAVLDLHAPKEGWPQVCAECNRVALGSSLYSTWPCATVTAITTALEGA
jgi:hypothetical protein